ncbi:MAG: serine/threonine protein kinase [Ktedonobacteraceae bacterium]|nr:serine/threonine protein kinase [Ktedonobacteraceae bacterium]
MREYTLVGQQMGNYRLIRLLGRGGFAEVYLAEHLHLDTQAAIKVLHTALVEDDEIASFRAEARIVAHLLHPHIVQVLEFGVENSLPFLVMRYAPGGSLRRLYPRGSRVPLATLTGYVKQAASALQYAHDQRLIHRDVKPENMLIGSNQELLLSDFGMALVMQSSRQSDPQKIAGTATYMAPEQFQGNASAASDQYALGVVVYEWLCGRVPFKGSFSEIASQHLFTAPPPLREQLPAIPAVLEQVVLKGLAKEASQRFASVSEFASAFEQASAACLAGRLALPASELPAPLSFESKAGYSTTEQRTTAVPLSEHEAIQPASAIAGQQKSETPRVSRRAMVIGLTLIGLTGVGVAAAALARLPHPGFFPPPIPSTPTTAPLSPTPTAAPPALDTTLYVYRGHHDEVEAAAWSPDSKRIATGSKDRTVQVWDAVDGGHAFTYTGHTDIVDAVAWSLPDGKRIASGSNDGTVQIWDAVDGGHVFTYRGHTDRVAAVAWSLDGKRVASGGRDKTVQVWDAANGGNLFTYRGHSAQVWALAWSPDGKRLASASADTTVQVWDAANGGNLFTYKGHSSVVDAVAWSPDGKRVASCSFDQTVQVWDAANGGHRYAYRGHNAEVWWIAWSPDGKRIASASSDHTVQVWDAANGGDVYTYRGHDAPVYFVAWSPDGTRLASGGGDTTVRVWQIV